MKILACYSNKGGVGKTASSVNLAYACATSGMKTLLCDLDPQAASGFYFRVKPSKKLKEATFFKSRKKLLGAIRASDFENLDLLPANMSFKDFDIFLDRMKKSSSRLKNALKVARSDYDFLILDCPPNISMLSENVFRTADRIIVPVIPTTLSVRTLEQLCLFFTENNFSRKKLLPFFSMVQMSKKLHKETMQILRGQYDMLTPSVPFSTDVERMGVNRAPVAAYAPRSVAAEAYRAVWEEIVARL